MEVVQIEGSEYAAMYSDLEPLVSLHSCWTDSDNDSQMTAWCLNGCDE